VSGVKASYVLLAVLLALAFAIRLDGITGPPFDNAVSRQFESALLARMYYLDGSRTLSVQQRQVLRAWHDEIKPIEPPIMELLGAGAYRVVGREALWIPRCLSALWWVLGGVFLYLIARRLQSPPAALAACAVYLFVPFALVGSRSFQPDPLMIAVMLAAILTIVRYDEQPSWARVGVATAVSAAALLVKPGIAAPIIFVVFAALAVRRSGTRRLLVDGQFLAFWLSALPMFGWYAYGTIAAPYLRGHVSAKLKPSLLAEPSFWSGWWHQIVFVVTYPRLSDVLTLLVLVLSAAGVLAAPRGRPRTLLLALWIGYACYGLVFTFHISTHNYYSLPVIPIVALSLGSAVDWGLGRLRVAGPAALSAVGLAAVLAGGLIAWKMHPFLADPSFRADAARYAEAGRLADHTSRGLYVDKHYGDPLRYYGWTAGTLLASGWETNPQRTARRTLAIALTDGRARRCLIFLRWPGQASLASFEADAFKRYAVRRRSSDIVIFDVRRLPGATTGRC
jgi:hypothetical protein